MVSVTVNTIPKESIVNSAWTSTTIIHGDLPLGRTRMLVKDATATATLNAVTSTLQSTKLVDNSLVVSAMNACTTLWGKIVKIANPTSTVITLDPLKILKSVNVRLSWFN